MNKDLIATRAWMRDNESVSEFLLNKALQVGDKVVLKADTSFTDEVTYVEPDFYDGCVAVKLVHGGWISADEVYVTATLQANDKAVSWLNSSILQYLQHDKDNKVSSSRYKVGDKVKVGERTGEFYIHPDFLGEECEVIGIYPSDEFRQCMNYESKWDQDDPFMYTVKILNKDSGIINQKCYAYFMTPAATEATEPVKETPTNMWEGVASKITVMHKYGKSKTVETVVKKVPVLLGKQTFWVNVYMDNQGQLVTPKGRMHKSEAEAKKYGKVGVDSKGWVYVQSVPVEVKGK